jgi:hypothetical protein
MNRHYRLLHLLLLLTLICFSSIRCQFQSQQADNEEGDVIVLVPRGEDPNTAKNRVVIPQGILMCLKCAIKIYISTAKNGILPPLPCLISGTGIYENGQTFTKGNFHYNCRNGTAEVIGSFGRRQSVIK